MYFIQHVNYKTILSRKILMYNCIYTIFIDYCGFLVRTQLIFRKIDYTRLIFYLKFLIIEATHHRSSHSAHLIITKGNNFTHGPFLGKISFVVMEQHEKSS